MRRKKVGKYKGKGREKEGNLWRQLGKKGGRERWSRGRKENREESRTKR